MRQLVTNNPSKWKYLHSPANYIVFLVTNLVYLNHVPRGFAGYDSFIYHSS